MKSKYNNYKLTQDTSTDEYLAGLQELITLNGQMFASHKKKIQLAIQLAKDDDTRTDQEKAWDFLNDIGNSLSILRYIHNQLVRYVQEERLRFMTQSKEKEVKKMNKQAWFNSENFRVFGSGVDILERGLAKYGITSESTGMQWDWAEMVGGIVSSFIKEYAPKYSDDYEEENHNNRNLISDKEIDRIFNHTS